MKNKPKQLVKGQWIDAVEIPYYPSLREKIGHFFGKHYYYENERCLICKRFKNSVKRDKDKDINKHLTWLGWG